MSSVLVRDAFDIHELDALAAQDCKVLDVIALSPVRGDTWVVLENTKTDHTFVYKLHEVLAFLTGMRSR